MQIPLKAMLRSAIQATPTPMAGLALGIASLGWCWNNLAGDAATQQWGAAIAAALLLLLAIKFIRYPAILREELAHPVVGSVIPTFSMALMVISNALHPVAANAAATLWVAAVVFHLAFMLSFFYHRAQDFRLHHLLPSWFVPPVGLAVAALTNLTPALAPVAQMLLAFALMAYLVLMPLMIYRLVFSAPVPDTSKPTLAVLAAPSSLCLAAYLQIAEAPSLLLVACLGGLAVLMTLVIYVGFFRLLRLPFSPGYAAFTFPMVISATALFKTAELLQGHAVTQAAAEQILQGAQVELMIATGIVVYVAIRYVRHYAGRMHRVLHPVELVA
ncbi:Uncharacterised protein [BD1-7 clade bacterium]|uniref:Tellurite resistance protein TehA n=1 Tax=BD1-7 clade bacterium TaxID=2029982 RepID=A0A5S9QWK4_9GAMM|nr:Uncharacterised protein [BD1-7 clade bacterium]